MKGRGRLPRRLREQVHDLRLRFQHGDTFGVLRLLDAGVGPHLRFPEQRTLLHLLSSYRKPTKATAVR